MKIELNETEEDEDEDEPSEFDIKDRQRNGAHSLILDQSIEQLPNTGMDEEQEQLNPKSVKKANASIFLND